LGNNGVFELIAIYLYVLGRDLVQKIKIQSSSPLTYDIGPTRQRDNQHNETALTHFRSTTVSKLASSGLFFPLNEQFLAKNEKQLCISGWKNFVYLGKFILMILLINSDTLSNAEFILTSIPANYSIGKITLTSLISLFI